MTSIAADLTVTVADFADLRRKQPTVRGVMDTVGFCVLRGLFDSREVLAEYEKHAARFNPADDIRRSGPLRPGMGNFQRLDCGDYAGVNARVSRTITRFFWNPPDTFSAHLAELQKIRDCVLQRNVAYDGGRYEVDGIKYFELPKILQYPIGGGFLHGHQDAYNFDGVFNIGMQITQIGRHFDSGGVYYHFKSGDELLLQQLLQPGDIYLHDGDALHGVHAVDPFAPLDLQTFRGRVALILSSETVPKA